MNRLCGWLGCAANFVSGVEEDPSCHDALAEEFEKQKVYLVTYGAYGTLSSFDPDCLVAIVRIEHSVSVLYKISSVG